jgi:hypothetical protein
MQQSRLGAGADTNLGTVTFVGTVEMIFNQTDSNVLHLRPSYFMENFLAIVRTVFDKEATHRLGCN